MPWDLIRDGESMTIDVDELQDVEIDALVEAVRTQVNEGVADVVIIDRSGPDQVRQTVKDVTKAIEALGGSVHVKSV
jgi:hypothetical protein